MSYYIFRIGVWTNMHHWLPQKQEASPCGFLISKDQWSMFKSALNLNQSAADLRLKSALYPACLIDTVLLYCREYSGVDDRSRSSSTHEHRENQAYKKCISSWPGFYLSPAALSHPGDQKRGDHFRLYLRADASTHRKLSEMHIHTHFLTLNV